MKVTVLMSVWNGERFVAEAVESVLAQTFGDFEFLIVDDASTDSTPAILAAYRDARVRILRNDENLGLTKSLNRGLREARGEYVARLDADDVCLPRRLELQSSFLNANPNVAVVGGQAHFIGENGRRRLGDRTPRSARAAKFALMFSSPLIHSAAMFRRSVVVDELHGYDEEFVTSQDVDLWSRISARHELRNLDAYVLRHRVHRGSISATRYTYRNVSRVQYVLHRAVMASTGDPALADAWPFVWGAVVNMAVFENTGGSDEAGELARALYEKAVARDPLLARDPDVNALYATVQMRIGAFQAGCGKAGAPQALARAFRVAPRVVFRRLPGMGVAYARRVVQEVRRG